MTTQPKVAHTPNKLEYLGTDGDGHVISIRDGTGKYRTLAHAYDETMAVYIVKAVNAHEDLLEALKEIYFSVEEISDKTRHKIGKIIGKAEI